MRALDRVYEASKKLSTRLRLKSDDITICIQADEPMLDPKMIDKSILFLKKQKAKCTLRNENKNKDQFYDKNILKIVHNLNGEVVYTSRSPIPNCKKFSKNCARRIYGIFAFRIFLKNFIIQNHLLLNCLKHVTLTESVIMVEDNLL